MEGLRQERKQTEQKIGNTTGFDAMIERLWVTRVQAIGSDASLLPIPIDADCVFQMNVTDPASADYGKQIFIPGISVPGNGDVFG